MTIVTPTPEITRDRYGRPLVIPPTGGKAVPYTRCTTYIDCLDDKFNLQKWQQRMVALGLAARPDLYLAVSAHRDDKRELDRICESSREAAAATAAATTGTALHALTEVIDRGQELPPLPANAKASLDAYAAATAALTSIHIEQFLVQDALQIGGTTDRIVKDGGTLKIADIKTGSIEWGALKIAMQLAVYARSHTYDIATATRGDHGASLTEGIVIHLPSVTDPADARCDLYMVDLEAGWSAVNVAKQVRTKRKLKFGDLMAPLGSIKVQPDPKVESARPMRDVMTAAGRRPLAQQVAEASTRDELEHLWAAHQDVWSDALTQAAAQRAAQITTMPPAVA